MEIKDIPLILPNFNQLTYLRNLINQFRFYYPDNLVHIIDNCSDYEPLIEFYDSDIIGKNGVDVWMYHENNFIANLNDHLSGMSFDYYLISDPDISIPPTTPPNFLEIFKTAIDEYGFHHAGFGLKTDDIPYWNPKAGWIQGDEKLLMQKPVEIEHEGIITTGYKAPIDTTFCLYKRDNGGWQAPMPSEAWNNSVRLFEAVHLPWYLHKDFLNEEMKHYFATCKRFEPGQVSSGKNNYRPE